MTGLVAIFVLLIAVALYGYFMPRLVNQRYYTPVNLGFGVLAVLYAKTVGVSYEDLGLNISWWSVIIASIALLIISLIVITILKYSRLSIKRDDYKQLLLRIPVGTALAEELIFRGAVMGILLHSYSKLTALLFSSIAFGLWHLLPESNTIWAQNNLRFNRGPVWLSWAYSGSSTVLVTGLGGLLFGWLRLAGGGILLPWVAHTAINAIAWTTSKTSGYKVVKKKIHQVVDKL